MRRAIRLLVIPFATVLLALSFQASPASADTVRFVPGGGGTGAVFTLGSDDVQPCDTAADGLGVRLSYVVNGVTRSVRDLNGSEPGCLVTQDVGTVTSFRVCSTQAGVNLNCTAWERPI